MLQGSKASGADVTAGNAMPRKATARKATIRWARRIVLASTDDELRAAAVLHPDPALAVAPGLAERAVRDGELAAELDPVARVHGTEVLASVLRLADDRLGVTAVVAPARRTERELGAAAAVDPHPVLVPAPRLVADAIALAELAVQLHPASHVGGAAMQAPVLRFADEEADIPMNARVAILATGILPVVLVLIAAVQDPEVGAAAVVDPDLAAAPAPRRALDALGEAELLLEGDAAVAGRAAAAMTVLRLAADHVVREGEQGDEENEESEQSEPFHGPEV